MTRRSFMIFFILGGLAALLPGRPKQDGTAHMARFWKRSS